MAATRNRFGIEHSTMMFLGGAPVFQRFCVIFHNQKDSDLGHIDPYRSLMFRIDDFGEIMRTPLSTL